MISSNIQLCIFWKSEAISRKKKYLFLLQIRMFQNKKPCVCSISILVGQKKFCRKKMQKKILHYSCVFEVKTYQLQIFWCNSCCFFFGQQNKKSAKHGKNVMWVVTLLWKCLIFVWKVQNYFFLNVPNKLHSCS